MVVPPDNDHVWLLARVYSGYPAAFTSYTSIDAHFLRWHILELAEAPASASRRSCLRWVIEKAVFREKLDLSDGRRADGGYLPAIEFRDCKFEDGFCADAAHIDRLFFQECRFVSNHQRHNFISLRNCRISTELRLEELRAEAGGLLYVDAFASSIGTNVIVQDCRLIAPEGESSATKPESRYALDLTNTDIKCDLRLTPRVELVGGLKMRDSRIGGTVWGIGLHVTDGETDKTRKRIILEGNQPRFGIRAQSAIVHGNLVLSADESRINDPDTALGADPVRFWCFGSLDLNNIHVDGSVYIAGARIDGPDSLFGLYGSFIGKDLSAFEVLLPLTKSRYDRRRLVLDTPMLNLQNCVIGGDSNLQLNCTSVLSQGLQVKGSLKLIGNVANIMSGGISVSRSALISLSNCLQCDLQGSTIGENLDLTNTSFHEIAPNVRQALKSLVLKDAKIGHSLDLSPVYSDVLEVISTHLSWYPGHALHVVKLVQAREEGVANIEASFITGIVDEPVLLDGSSRPIHDLNARYKIHLRTESMAKDYLQFFCAYVWAEFGSFALIDTEEQLPEAFKARIAVHPIEISKQKPNIPQVAYYFNADVRYGQFLYRAVFKVEAQTGVVEMEDDSPWVVDGESVIYRDDEVPKYRSPYRITGRVTALDFKGTSESENDIKKFVQEVPNWKQILLQYQIGNVSVNLRDAQCGILHDDCGRLWSAARFVDMQEFKYRETFTDEDWVGNEVEARIYNLSRQEALPFWQLVRNGKLHELAKQVTTLLARVRLVLFVPASRWSFKVSRRVFQAQPYAHLAKVLRERGDDVAARQIEAAKLRWGAYHRAEHSFMSRLAVWFWWWPYGFLFKYGLSALRAMVTLVVFLILGTLSIVMLSQNGFLNANEAVVSQTVLDAQQPVKHTDVVGCGEKIVPLLYAAELMTPVVNFREANRCDIRTYQPGDEYKTLTLWKHPLEIRFWGHTFTHPHWMANPRKWEYLKGAYIVLGNIITSLALLTFSGIARKWEH